jgi:hypothetical protein
MSTNGMIIPTIILCVPIYCFCSGYAHTLVYEKDSRSYTRHLPSKAVSLLKNYWVVVILFSSIGLVFAPQSTVPGNFSAFFGNLFLYGMSYNGAWWFVITYLLLLFLSPCTCRLVKKVPVWLALPASFALYFIAYILRFNYTIPISQPVLKWGWDQCVLLGTSQFPYFIGTLCYHHRWISKAKNILRKCPLINAAIYFLPVAAFVGHCIIQSAFVAPFTAAAVLTVLFLGKQPRWFSQLFLFLGKHSTNIWLTHMFFYFSLFPNLVFRAVYPPVILLFMMALCVVSSIIINWLISRFDLLFRSFLCQK